MADELSGKRIAIVLGDGFETVEMTQPKRTLEAAGATVHLVAPQGKAVTGDEKVVRGLDFPEWGENHPVDVWLHDADPSDYDGLYVPGGIINPDLLRMNEQAVAFIKSFFDAGKPVASMCHGPWLLIEANVVRGRTLTSWPSLHTDLRNAGATWVDREVVRDGGLVTSRNPNDLPAFNREMVRLFAEQPAATV